MRRASFAPLNTLHRGDVFPDEPFVRDRNRLLQHAELQAEELRECSYRHTGLRKSSHAGMPEPVRPQIRQAQALRPILKPPANSLRAQSPPAGIDEQRLRTGSRAGC